MPRLENNDDISFSELMKKSVSEIPQLCAEWTDFNAHDPGITFLEMLMWLTEMQRYYLSQITEDHLKSYLKLIGTEMRAAEPTRITARFISEDTVSVKRGTVFYIGDIPYSAADDMVIVPDRPEIIIREGGGYFIKQDLAPFKGKTFPLYFSSEDENCANPMREGFYSRAKIKVFLSVLSGETECHINDGTFGFYQSGFINIDLPDEFDENKALLRLDIFSDDDFKPPSASCFHTDIRELIQTDKEGNTLGANGRVKENVSFSADVGGQRSIASVCKEIGIGKDPETAMGAFERSRSERLHSPRAVKKEDYERLALSVPGLRAELVNVFSKETGKVSVCVKTADGKLRENELKNLRKILYEAKPVGTEIEILTPIVFSASLAVSAKIDGWAGDRKLTEHIRGVFEPIEKSMGALLDMPEILKQIGSSPSVSEIKSVHLRLGKGIELTEKDTMKLPEDGLLSLNEIIIQ